MLLQHKTPVLSFAPQYNGIGCPRCSSVLVNSTLYIRNNKRETSCLICDYASSYNVQTFELDKKY